MENYSQMIQNKFYWMKNYSENNLLTKKMRI